MPQSSILWCLKGCVANQNADLLVKRILFDCYYDAYSLAFSLMSRVQFLYSSNVTSNMSLSVSTSAPENIVFILKTSGNIMCSSKYLHFCLSNFWSVHRLRVDLFLMFITCSCARSLLCETRGRTFVTAHWTLHSFVYFIRNYKGHSRSNNAYFFLAFW